jgi:NADP-dependent aldehyde dehydrogenase
MELTGLNLIGNKESGIGSKTFSAKNPATLEDLDIIFHEATPAEAAEAVLKAKVAFPLYKAKSSEAKAVFLETIADSILGLGDELIKRCMLETALPMARLNGERMRTVTQLRLFASVVREGSWIDARIDTGIPGRLPAPKPDIRQMQVPLGPVGIFGASNFPFAFSVAGGDTVSALAAGCPVVVKSHPLHPGTSEMVGKAILNAAKQTNMPDGVFSMVQGTSNEVGMAIVNHPEIKAIGFTGSFRGGKAIFDAANNRSVPIPVFAEMGSVNPVFILPGALKDRNEIIAKGLIGAISMGVGQFCTNPGLVIIEQSEEANLFLQNLKSSNESVPSGTMLSEQIKNNFSKGVQNLDKTNNVKLISSSSGKEFGNNVKTKVYSTDFETFVKNDSLAEEIFGPSTLNVTANNKSEMLRLAEKLEGHLTATIHGTERDLVEYSELMNILEQKVGRLIFNGFPTGVEVCHSMVHGGPYPATTAPQSTSVGTAAIKRFVRPICFQDFPDSILAEELKDENPLKIWRLVNGELTKNPV